MKAARALYPTDFSEDSLRRISDAVAFCIQNKAELVVLYAYRLINRQSSKSNGYSLKKDMDFNASETFKSIEDNYLKELPINYRLLSEVGFVDDRIAHSIKKHDIDNILLCRSLYDQLENKIIENPKGNKKLFDLPVVEV